MIKRYRKFVGRFEPWHFLPDCRDWPEANYIERSDTPSVNDLCEKCVELSAEKIPEKLRSGT